MKGTLIHWADDTVNPTSGCDGCELWKAGVGGPCYAGNFHEVRLAKTLPLLYAPTFDEVRLIPGRMAKAVRCMDLAGQRRLAGRGRPAKPWLDGRRRSIFVGDMGDIFSAAVPFDYLKTEIIDVANSQHGRRHDLLLLTKQPGRAASFATWLNDNSITWPDNVWIGTSITGPGSIGRIKRLAQIPAKHRYLSVEPLVDDPCLTTDVIAGVVDWVIIGGESTQGRYKGRTFDLNWARRIIASCREAGNISPFMKQLGSMPVDGGSVLKLSDSHGENWDEWPADLRVRELPAA